MKKFLLHFICRYPLTLLCVVSVWYLCLFKPPGVDLGVSLVGLDKAVHVLMYLGTCSVLWWEYLRKHKGENIPRLLLGGVVAPMLMSGVVELVQDKVGRSADWLDFAANAAGVVLAALFGHFCLRPYLIRKKSK